MTLTIGRRRKTRRAFTLIELVLVMAILIVVLSTTGASLTHFFRGRTLDAEARRFVALTRHAQNRAVSEGLPMTLWIDERGGRYGLQTQHYENQQRKEATYDLARDLTIKVERTPVALQGSTGLGSVNEAAMLFSPDGTMSDTNPERVILSEASGESVVIVPSRNRLNYEVSTNSYGQRR